jgi:hypothetical protein
MQLAYDDSLGQHINRANFLPTFSAMVITTPSWLGISEWLLQTSVSALPFSLSVP